MSSATDLEIGGFYENSKISFVLCNTLQGLSYPQQPTSIKTDNLTAAGFANKFIKRKYTRAINMCFY